MTRMDQPADFDLAHDCGAVARAQAQPTCGRPGLGQCLRAVRLANEPYGTGSRSDPARAVVLFPWPSVCGPERASASSVLRCRFQRATPGGTPWPGFTTLSERAAEALVRAYLNGRSLLPILHGAVVWMAAARLSGKRPVLHEILSTDTDFQAIPQPECIRVRLREAL